MVLATGIFCGGIAQIIAGIMEYKKGNTFGTTAFTSYGLFWLSLVAIWVIPGTNPPAGDATPAAYLGWYLFLRGLFTLFMWIGTFGKNRVVQFVFLPLTVLFWLLAARDWTGSAVIGKIAGFEGIICGLSAIYPAMAKVLNEARGRTVLLIGESKKLGAHPSAFPSGHKGALCPAPAAPRRPSGGRVDVRNSLWL